MPRRSNATAEAEQNESSEQPKTEWKAKTHTDGDLRLPKKLRAELGIKGHGVYEISVENVGENGKNFTLKFSLKED